MTCVFFFSQHGTLTPAESSVRNRRPHTVYLPGLRPARSQVCRASSLRTHSQRHSPSHRWRVQRIGSGTRPAVRTLLIWELVACLAPFVLGRMAGRRIEAAACGAVGTSAAFLPVQAKSAPQVLGPTGRGSRRRRVLDPNFPRSAAGCGVDAALEHLNIL